MPSENIVADTRWRDDDQYESYTISEVTPTEDGWSIGLSDTTGYGGHFYAARAYGYEPHAGDTARLYGKGFGYPVRGLVINGTLLYYRSEAEQQAKFEQEMAEADTKRRQEFEQNRADHDRRIAALPDVFQRRIAKFQNARDDFRWQHEGYELFTCEQAVEIANALADPSRVTQFRTWSNEEQKAAVPALSDDHSGNTFGMACRLAHSYLTDPELVVADHGALVGLVGCEAYGCPHPESEARS